MKRTICILLALLLTAGYPAALAEEAVPVSQMTIRQLILQKIVVSVRKWSDVDVTTKEERDNLPGLTAMNEPVRAFFSAYQPGGVILFANSTKTTENTVRLIRDMQAAVTGSGAPEMLVTVDQEGGRITRLAQGTSLPGNMALGATGSAKNARLAARVIGEELAALGFSMDCAPSLDVNCNPLNPVINVRSFGEDPALVAKLGVAFLQELRETGVIPIVKHFPGHGDTRADSHSDLPLVDKSLAEIQRTELAPFQAAIDAGAPVVMTAHIQYPALDDTAVPSLSTGEPICLPATLSRKILTGLLREKMGFQGVIITDAMNMDAIALHFGAGDALTRAFEAGVDIALMPVEIMCPGDIAIFEAAVAQVEAAVEEGRLTREMLEASVERIRKLKASAGNRSEATVETAQAVVASAEHRAIERKLSAAAVTVIANDGTLPMTPRAGDTLLICAAYQNEATALRFGVERLMREGRIPELTLTEYVYQSCTDIDDELRGLLDGADAVLMDSELSSIAGLVKGKWAGDMPLLLIDEMNRRGLPYCDISIHLPEDAALLTNARALVAVFNPSGMSDAAYQDGSYAFGPSLPGAVDVIFGVSQAQGTLPVTVYALNEAREVDLNTVLYPCGYAAPSRP